MRNRLMVLVGALSLLAFSPILAQGVSTQATISSQTSVSPQPVVTQGANSTIGTARLPKSVESALNTVIALPMPITTGTLSASSATSVVDSLSRKDDSALILTAFSLSQFGIGGKLWLTENTAVRVSANANIGLALTLFGNFQGSQDYRQSQVTGQQTTSQQTQSKGFASGKFSNQSAISLSFSIEKHVFQKRAISPFIGFGLDAGVSFNSWISGGGGGQKNLDTSEFQTGGISSGGQTQTQSSNGQQALRAVDSYRFGAHLLVGVEYFVLPSISLAAQAGVSGDLGLSYYADVNNATNVPTQNVTPQPNQPKVSQVSSTQVASAAPTFGFYANTWFSISAQVYLGRGAAQEMANTFLNIFSNW